MTFFGANYKLKDLTEESWGLGDVSFNLLRL